MKYLILHSILVTFFLAQSKTETIKKTTNGYVKTIQIDFDKVSTLIKKFKLEASIGEIEIIKSDKKSPYLISKIFIRVRDEGNGSADNCQLTHPYCNQSIKQ